MVAYRPLLAAFVFFAAVLSGCTANDPADKGSAGTATPMVGDAIGGDPNLRAVSVPPGTYDFTGPYSRLVTKGNLSILPAQRVTTPSPIDGGDIEMGLFLPDTTEKVPAIVFATPYMDAEGAISGTTTVLNPSGSVRAHIEDFVPHGYAWVNLSIRGTGGSDGCNDLMGPQEVEDLDAAMTWIGEQPWSAGAIAMTGVSYDGSTPWSVASTGNPYLKTIIPVSGVPDIYGLMYRNGSSETRGPLLLNALYIEGSLDSGTPAEAPGRLCPEAVEGLALSGVAGALGEDPTGYWQARNRKPAVEANYKGSVFSIQGLQDWNVDPSQVVPWVDQLESQGIRTKQLLGQWGHAWPDGIGEGGANVVDDATDTVRVRADYKEILLRWLDQELKGIPSDTGPAVQVRDNMGRWRNEAHYPPHDTNWTTYHLDGDSLSLQPGSARSTYLFPALEENLCIPSPPTPVCPDRLPPQIDLDLRRFAEFRLAPVDHERLVVGLPKVHVTVTPQGPGGYMGAYLYADPDPTDTDPGRPIGWTTMNLRFHDGSTQSQDVMPNEPILAKMEIQPMDAVIPANHTLLLRVWILSDQDRLPTIPPSTVTLNTGGATVSVLKLPTIERSSDVYFSPPRPK